MKVKKSERSDAKTSKNVAHMLDFKKHASIKSESQITETILKYSNSFNSNSEFPNFTEKNIQNDLTLEINLTERKNMNELSFEHKRGESLRTPPSHNIQSFPRIDSQSILRSQGLSQSQPEIKNIGLHDLNYPLIEQFIEQNESLPPENKTDPKKKPYHEKGLANSMLNISHLEDYIKNHPMKLNIQENFDKTFKILDKNSTTYQNNFMKQKMFLIKNMETKMHRPEQTSIKTQTPQSNVTSQIHKVEKSSRAATKIKTNSSTSENKILAPKFSVLHKFEEQPIFKKKDNGRLIDEEEIKKKVKPEFEFNHVFKILDFLDKDKELKISRKKIQDKMKELGRESFNETNRKNIQLEQINEVNFLKEFKIKHVLGKGSYGEVKLCVNEKTGQLFAVKIYPKKFLKDKIKKQNLQNERDLLLQIDHENIIKLYKTVDGAQFIYLLTEYAGKASLHEVLTNSTKTCIDENDAKDVIRQLCKAILYLHEEGIIHRDVKLHNILINDEGQLKLIDFGFALKLKEDELIHVFCGTPSYMSPEIVNRIPYDGKASDIWAFGVCIYRLVVGTFPFRGFLISCHGRRALSENKDL